MSVQMREAVSPQGAQPQTQVQTIGRPNVCQCEIRAAKSLWCTAVYCCFQKMEWREKARVRHAAGSVLRELFSWRGPLIRVEQATFVLYLRFWRLGWDELWSGLLVCKRVDAEVGQDVSETPEALHPQTPYSILWKCSCARGKVLAK